MSLIDLDSPDLNWLEIQPAGSPVATRMCSVWRDDERGLRSILCEFPEGWTRDAVGNQPAQEEMVALSGTMRMSGLRSGVGQMLVGPPHATRSDTSNEGDARVLVWFSGESGGWQDGPADPEVHAWVVDLEPGMVRDYAEGMVGAVEVIDEVGGRTFEHDVDLLWIEARKFVHLAPGEAAPEVSGRAVVRHWG